MLLTEIFDQEMAAYEDPEADNTVPSLNDLRKTKLTLGAINRLRKIEDVRRYELEHSIQDIQKQYGKPAEAAPGGF